MDPAGWRWLGATPWGHSTSRLLGRWTGRRSSVLKARLDERPEQRMRLIRPRFEFRVELAGDEPGMILQLDRFNQVTRLERRRDD